MLLKSQGTVSQLEQSRERVTQGIALFTKLVQEGLKWRQLTAFPNLGKAKEIHKILENYKARKRTGKNMEELQRTPWNCPGTAEIDKKLIEWRIGRIERRRLQKNTRFERKQADYLYLNHGNQNQGNLENEGRRTEETQACTARDPPQSFQPVQRPCIASLSFACIRQSSIAATLPRAEILLCRNFSIPPHPSSAHFILLSL